MIHTLYRRALAMACAVAAIGGLGMAADAAAEERPLILVVPYPPGGSTDILARILQPRLSQELGGRAVVVENRPGAASQIATAFVARAEPDGNTLLVSFDNHGINPAVKPKLPYDTFKDFVAITQTVRFPLVLGANPSVPGDNLKDFLAAAGSRPIATTTRRPAWGRSITWPRRAQAPVQGGTVARALWRRRTSDPGRGGRSGQHDLAQLRRAAWPDSGGQDQAAGGRRRKRLADLPNVPTVAESGFPGFVAYSWSGMFAPKGTPDATIKKLTRDFKAVLADPDVRRKLGEAGFEIVASDGPALDAYVKAEYERWNAFIKTSNINLEN